MDYQHKYLKYKLKYFNYLKQKSTAENSLPQVDPTGGNYEEVRKEDKLECVYNPLIDQIGGNHVNLLEDNTKNFIATLNGKPAIYTLKPVQARDVLNTIQKDESYKSMVDMTTQDLDVVFENQKISITIFRPKDNNNMLDAIIFFYGGGWILGSKQTHGRLISEIAVGAGTAVVVVNYTPAPDERYLKASDKKFPTQLSQCYLATKYILLNGLDEYNIRTDKVILAGDSVGGNMVASVTLMAETEPDMASKIGYQILLYPVTSAAMITESYEKYKNGPWLTKASMEWFFDAYELNKEKRMDPFISPLNASIDQLSLVPSGLVITAENDVLRDEGEAYAHKLMNAGVRITAVRFLGTTHDFLMLDPLKDTPAVVSAKILIIDHVKKFFKNN